ncbi:MAG: DUF2201 family putative metallopeptidase [Bacteroides thetaiotaomicron]
MKTAAFLSSNAAFLGSLMCQLGDIIWDESIPTVQVDGEHMWWNPHWFLGMQEECRKTVLLHELWHVGRLHGIRGEGKDPDIWNQACDYVINNTLDKEGYSFAGLNGLIDHKYDNMSEEEVYELLIKGNKPKMPIVGIGRDLRKPADPIGSINKVVIATQQAKIGGGTAGTIPGEVIEIIDKFLNPVLPWEVLLKRFMTELDGEDVSWQKRSRRFPDVYMPGKVKVEGGLTHLAYFLDVSGSISDYDILRFNSEVKHVKNHFNPQKLTLVLFDTKIQKTIVFTEFDDFDKVVVCGRGGTSLQCVHDWIKKNKPTAAIIFTDMECHPMDPVSIPVLWVVSGNHGHKPTFGKVINITGKV